MTWVYDPDDLVVGRIYKTNDATIKLVDEPYLHKDYAAMRTLMKDSVFMFLKRIDQYHLRILVNEKVETAALPSYYMSLTDLAQKDEEKDL